LLCSLQNRLFTERGYRGSDVEGKTGDGDEPVNELVENITEIAVSERCDLASHVNKSFLLALAETSEIDEALLTIEGMSGKKYRRFINNLIRSLKDTKYLEVGSWAGSTLCSAINGNSVCATAIDNWSQFGGPKDKFLENLNRFQTPKAYVNFIEEDFRKVDFSAIGEFTTYLFDGPHNYEDQYDGLKLALPCLEPQFVYIVDDWNWTVVRNGTIRAISDLEIKIYYAIEIRTTLDGTHPPIAGRNSDWHNGYFISVLSKPTYREVDKA
jgi:Methyltransferase domain